MPRIRSYDHRRPSRRTDALRRAPSEIPGRQLGVSANEPMPTITSGAGAVRPAGAAHAMGIATAILAGVGGRAGDSKPRSVAQPGYTTTGKADCAVVTAFLEQANGGFYEGAGADVRDPKATTCVEGSMQRLVTAQMVSNCTNNLGTAANDPLKVITTGGKHVFVECTLSPEHEAGALRVAAFLVKYYGTALGVDLRDPLDIVTTRDRLALVTVMVRGAPYVIVDIGLRMLRPHELYRAQGFPADYIIDRTADGTPITTTAAVRMVGNSVSPPPLRAIAIAIANTVPQRIEEAIAT